MFRHLISEVVNEQNIKALCLILTLMMRIRDVDGV